MCRGWFITGTDTGVGKTRVARELLRELAQRGLAAAGMKPVASGCRETPDGPRSEDAEALIAASSVRVPYDDVNPYALIAPAAPHLAAAAEGVEIRIDVIENCYRRLCECTAWIVVEGTGGWLVPLGDDRSTADLARRLDLPLILVVGVRLGCLNHALLTVAAIRGAGVPLAGWVANAVDPAMLMLAENVAALEARIDAPLLTVFGYAGRDDVLPRSKPLLARLL